MGIGDSSEFVNNASRRTFLINFDSAYKSDICICCFSLNILEVWIHTSMTLCGCAFCSHSLDDPLHMNQESCCITIGCSLAEYNSTFVFLISRFHGAWVLHRPIQNISVEEPRGSARRLGLSGPALGSGIMGLELR